MILCKDCGIPMVAAMSFSNEGNEKCYAETKHVKLRESDLDFGEVLHKAIDRRENHGHK
mgnify:CR=1 FL=1